MHTATQVTATFAAVRETVSPEFAERIASQLSVYSMEDALSFAGADTLAHGLSAESRQDATDFLTALLAYRTALVHVADPKAHAMALRHAALQLDARSERLAAEAAEYFGKAAFRRKQGETVLADGFQRSAEAAEAVAVQRAEEAADKRAFAAELEGRAARAATLAGVVAPVLHAAE